MLYPKPFRLAIEESGSIWCGWKVPSAKVRIDYRMYYAYTCTCAAHTNASRGPLGNAQPMVIYSRFIELYAWAYGTIYGCQPEMDLYLTLVSTDILLLYAPSLRVCMRARWRLTACSRAYLRACLRAYLREQGFGRSRVFLHWKPLANGKLWVCGSFA